MPNYSKFSVLTVVSSIALYTASVHGEECTPLPQKCFQAIIEEDMAYWSDGGKSVIGRIIEDEAVTPTRSQEAVWCRPCAEIVIPEECTKLINKYKERGCNPFNSGLKEKVLKWLSGKPDTDLDTAYKNRLSAWSAFRSTDGYNNAKWGMPPTEVKKAVKGLKDKKNAQIQLLNFAGFDAQAEYIFSDGRLTSVVISPIKAFIIADKYLAIYDRVIDLLQQKYSDPDENETEYTGPGEDYEEQGVAGAALRFEKLKKWAVWESEKTRIEVRLGSNELQPEISIVYRSVELESFAQKTKDKKESKNL